MEFPFLMNRLIESAGGEFVRAPTSSSTNDIFIISILRARYFLKIILHTRMGKIRSIKPVHYSPTPINSRGGRRWHRGGRTLRNFDRSLLLKPFERITQSLLYGHYTHLCIEIHK